MATTTIDNLILKSPLRATVPVDNSTHEDRDYDLYGELEMESGKAVSLNNGQISKPGDPSVTGTFGINPDRTLWLNLRGEPEEHTPAMNAIAAFIAAAMAKTYGDTLS